MIRGVPTSRGYEEADLCIVLGISDLFASIRTICIAHLEFERDCGDTLER
jgi:hypothetical protein